jgi:hypothetical protein
MTEPDPNVNRYRPPVATVSDAPVDAIMKRPVAVTIAVSLIGVQMLMAMVAIVTPLRLGVEGTGASLLMVIGWGVVGLVVKAIQAAYIFTGRNWARLFYLFTTIASLSLQVAGILAYGSLPEGMRSAPNVRALVMIALPNVLPIAAIVLLFGPGRDWFARRE